MDAIAELVASLGADVVTLAPVGERYRTDWTGLAPCDPVALVRPRSTAEVSAALAICDRHHQPVVAQGGLTGLAGGAVPSPGDVALSLERMVGVAELDPDSATMTVWAGTTLEAAQQAAAAAGFELTLDLGARGSCTIGGNLATNAGGNRVIRYGMAREHVLGLEAVLADGTVLTSLSKMLKNNAGYDLRQLFIGSEGTLGVITRAVLRLRPAPAWRATMLLATPRYDAAVAVLRLVQRATSALSAFEVMWPAYYRALAEIRGVRAPIEIGDGLAVLVEISGDESSSHDAAVERIVSAAIDDGSASDAFVAGSAHDAADIWGMRESGPLDAIGDLVHFDIGLPIGSIGRFVEECGARLSHEWPAARAFPFGHIGDGNLHQSVTTGDPVGEVVERVDDLVYELVGEYGGTISAEHGIGTLKAPYLHHSRSTAEVATMRRIKSALDPHGILNPGKVIP